MAESTMLAKVKLALRINHTLLDTDITDTIATARAEMKRAGCGDDLADSNENIVQMAIKTYCLYVYSNDSKMSDGYLSSWQYQLDNLRKSTIALQLDEDDE